MVSVYPNPSPSQEFSHFYGCYMGGDPMRTGISAHLFESSSCRNTDTGGAEDPNKKTRKPYTITKSRETWSEQEHDKFLEALQLFDRDWKKIEAFVGSKTVIQIRSHAQKYFQKVLKNGKSEHLPPPRPKRKANHPYPHKSPKNATGVVQSSDAVLDSAHGVQPDSSSVRSNPVGSIHFSPWLETEHLPRAGGTMAQKCSSSNNVMRRGLKNLCKGSGVMPDFAQVYGFIGSLFDNSASDHLQRLKNMDPINLQAALTLMKNLSINLASPEFEDHRRLLSSYQVSTGTHYTGSTIEFE
ncbi:protein REVEILLE 6-like isoform X1 [Primulina huaijiensis]|uniref:protein REVEILLE 6-like isoform X1 n=1 Tax=Primulina huaijiensis TaxID=1492673 RepID=UPI003CC797D8